MIDIWVKLVSNQFELALNLTRAAFGLGGMEAAASPDMAPAAAVVPDRADASAVSPTDGPAQETVREEERFAAIVPKAEAKTSRKAARICRSGAGKIPGRQIVSQTGSARAEEGTIQDIISFLESANRGATVREIAERLEVDKKNILPLLKTLVKERRIDELLGRYCVLKN